ncbi:MAG: hypothetical protein WA139_01360 [Candidatus Aenigmatarchaeota archaeon]
MQKIAESVQENESSITGRILREIDENPAKINEIRRKWIGLGCEENFKKVFYDAPAAKLSDADFDVGRGVEVMKIVFDTVKHGDFVFKNGSLRGEIFPENIGEKDKAILLYYTAPFLPRTKSRDVYKRMCEFFESNREIFSPEFVRSCSAEYLGKIFLPRMNMVNRRGEIPRKWTMLSEHLKEYNDNPLELFSGCNDHDSLIQRIDEIPFYGRKTANYFLNACVKEGLIDIPSGECNFAVDLHKARFVVQTEMLKKERRGIYFRPHDGDNNIVIERYYKEVCEEGGFDIHEADENIWQWSSNGCSKKKCKDCPIDEKCTFGVWPRSLLDYGVFDLKHDYLGRSEALKQKKLSHY